MPRKEYATCPYKNISDKARWNNFNSLKGLGAIGKSPFKIGRNDLVATAGSCFAQNISRNLKANGFNYYVVEAGYPGASASLREKYGYGVFSARYGNIYSPLQLLQLLRRSLGELTPRESPWRSGNHWRDPLRPFIQPDGFESTLELEYDRRRHLDLVRHMFETLDVFVFTLGLTEAWVTKADGVALPVCPGCGAGVHSDEHYAFVNFRYPDVVAQVDAFISTLRSINGKSKIILTVSPVPLIATYSDSHVLSAVGYSKAVLRAAAEDCARSHDGVVYFPSYEIVTNPYEDLHHFAADSRSVTKEGVGRVMKVFFAEMCADAETINIDSGDRRSPNIDRTTSPTAQADAMTDAFDVICDEAIAMAGLET
jgi:hypothetical protein